MKLWKHVIVYLAMSGLNTNQIHGRIKSTITLLGILKFLNLQLACSISYLVSIEIAFLFLNILKSNYHNCKANSPNQNIGIIIITCIHKYLSIWHSTFQGIKVMICLISNYQLQYKEMCLCSNFSIWGQQNAINSVSVIQKYYIYVIFDAL